MVLIEIPDNPNCVSVEQRVFHDLAPAQAITQVRLSRPDGVAAWCDVTGWTTAGAPCPARWQKVDDSGEGVAYLVYGGEAGLRFRLAGADGPWRLDAPDQWGEPFLIIADVKDVRAGSSVNGR